jgi:hypothetical protein
LRQQRRRITLGVKRDEQYLHLVGLFAERRHHLPHGAQCCGADIRALRVTEKDDGDLAFEIRQPARLTRRIEQ